MELLEGLERLTAQGEKAVVATLVRTEGTSPRKEGARMWVGADGRIMGSVTIGGGGGAPGVGGGRLLARGLPRGVESRPPRGAASVFLEVFFPPPPLWGVGASHVAIPL